MFFVLYTPTKNLQLRRDGENELLECLMAAEVAKGGSVPATSAVIEPISSAAAAPSVVTASQAFSAADSALNYEIPSWAGRPPNGCHLDVVKGDQLIQVTILLLF